MAELGPTAPGYHREVGELVAEPRRRRRARRRRARARLRSESWRRDAGEAVAARLKELVQPGDVVLVKGSRAVGLEIVAEALTGVPA